MNISNHTETRIIKSMRERIKIVKEHISVLNKEIFECETVLNKLVGGRKCKKKKD